MRFFLDRDNIKDKTIYAVRGNHDCYFDLYRELELPKTYPKWFMPDLYYSRKFDIGEGKYLGVIFVDSCFALCSNYSFPNGTGGQLLMASPEMKRLRDVQCGDPVITAMGNQMFDWMKATMIEWEADPTIVWKATV